MRGLTKNLRKRAAIAIAVAYAFCVVAPTAALAVIASPTVFHCIGELNAKAAPAMQPTAAHVHEDGSAHHHGQASHGHGNHQQNGPADHRSDADDKTHDSKAHDNKAHAGSCCGLFCVSALAHDPCLTFGISTPASSSVAAVANGLIGRAPVPLHRPPIA